MAGDTGAVTTVEKKGQAGLTNARLCGCASFSWAALADRRGPSTKQEAREVTARRYGGLRRARSLADAARDTRACGVACALIEGLQRTHPLHGSALRKNAVRMLREQSVVGSDCALDVSFPCRLRCLGEEHVPFGKRSARLRRGKTGRTCRDDGRRYLRRRARSLVSACARPALSRAHGR